MENNDDNIKLKLEDSNRSKYGQKEYDLISQNYRNSKQEGDNWCGNNAIKYISRYKKEGSSKAGNITDLLKAADYLNRMIEKHNELSPAEFKEE